MHKKLKHSLLRRQERLLLKLLLLKPPPLPRLPLLKRRLLLRLPKELLSPPRPKL
jgi:hypothetical protein